MKTSLITTAFLALFGAFSILSLPVTAFAALPSGFVVDTVATGLMLPTSMVFADDGDIFVAEKSGVVRLIENGVLRPTPVITLTDVNDYADHGLLGIELDEAASHLYLLYTYENSPASYQGPKTSRLVRVSLDESHTAIPGSEIVLLGTVGGTPAQPSCENYPVGSDCIPSDGASHSIADISFGPDGKLYLSVGDSASFDYVDVLAQRSQNLDVLSGKVLRINPDGTAPADNPFYTGDPTDNRSKVYAYGFRNPFRFSFHPINGKMYLGDVGWYTAEEVNVVTAGGNYGWPCHEGSGATEGYNCSVTPRVNPLYAYPHDVFGSGSVVGGVFYTGSLYPGAYTGSYFIGDFSQNWIKRIVVDANDQLVSVEDFMTDAGGPVDFAADANGDIYYLSIYSGEVRKIRVVSGNRNPVPVISASPTSGLAPLEVTFSSVGSSDPDADVFEYVWDFGDGESSTSADPTHTYVSNGVYHPRLTLADGQGGIASTSVSIVVGNRAPTASIVNPPNGSFYSPGQIIPLSGLGIDAEEGTLPSSAYRWRVILHHNVHYHILESLSGALTSFVAPDHGSDPDVYIEVELTVMDSAGLSDTKSINMFIAPPATLAPYHVLTVTNGTPSINSSVGITTRVGNAGAPAPFLVDLEVYNQNNILVAQRFFDGTVIEMGSTSDYLISFTPTDAGTYRVAVGLIYQGWQGLYQWVNNALTFVVSNLWSPIAPNGALAFDGVDDRVETEVWNIEEANGFTLEARFIAQSFNGNQFLMSKASGMDNDGIDWAVGVHALSETEGEIFFMLRTDVGGLTTLAGGTVALGEYIHASAVYDGTTMTVFKNSVSAASIAKSGVIATGPHHVWLGARADSGAGAFHGYIDEIRVWNEPQSQIEIEQWGGGELTQKEFGLIKNWRFNEGFGQVVIDSSNSGHHGTLGSIVGAIDGNDPTRLGGQYPAGGTFAPILDTVTAGANPLQVMGTTTITIPVTNTGDGSGFIILNVEVYDDQNVLIQQSYFDGEGFAPGETRNFSVPFSGGTIGNYRVAVGLVHLFWSDIYSWNNSAMVLEVASVVANDPFGLTHVGSVVTKTSTAIGDSATLTSTIQNTGDISGAGIVDFEVFDASGTQVYQQFYQNETFLPNESRTFTLNFTPASADTYRVALGLIHDEWSGLYQWVNQAASISASSSIVLPPTPTTTSATVFDEELSLGWQNWSWDTTVIPSVTTSSGMEALQVGHTSAWGGFYLHHDGFDTTGKNSLRFFIRSVEVSAPALQITAFDEIGNPLPSRPISLYVVGGINSDGYTEVIVPLSALSAQNILTKGFMIQGVTGNIEPAYLVDAVVFD